MVDRLDRLPAPALKNAGTVDHRIDALEPRRPDHGLGILVEVDSDRRCFRETPPDRLRVAHRDDHFVAGLEQTGGQPPAYETTSSQHEYPHGTAPGILPPSNLRQAG